MNPDTGAIAVFETDDDAVTAGHTIPLPNKLAGRLLNVPRDQRMHLVLNISSRHPLARVDGMTALDARKLRNAAKRARQLRAK